MPYTAINRSCTPEDARRLRTMFEEMGWVAAANETEAAALEKQRKIPFIDHTNNGTDCFSAAEMADFRVTDCTQPGAFDAHQRRWGHE